MEFSREEGESDGKGNRTEREGEREREMGCLQRNPLVRLEKRRHG